MTTAPTSRAIEATAIYTVAEAARLISMHPDSFRKMLKNGSIRGSKRLGDWRVKGAELLKLA